MGQVKVRILDDQTLVLEEDAKKGDTIDLKNVQSVDLTYINKFIESTALDTYKNQLERNSSIEKERLADKYKNDLNELSLSKDNKIKEVENTLEKLKEFQKMNEDKIINEKSNELKDLKNSFEIKLKDKENEFNDLLYKKLNELKGIKDNEVLALKDEINNYKITISNHRQELDKKILETKSQLSALNNKEKEILIKKNNDDLLELRLKIQKYENELANYDSTKKLEIEKNNLENEKQLSNLQEEFRKEKSNLEEKIQRITLQKSSLNVKMLGEELEKWCDEEYESYASSGFLNATWDKDNSAIKDDDETKGTKADYIFRVYLDEGHTTELSSVCLEMKNESLTSVNKKKNSDHYQKLDKDRTKKECEYALLVSELEWTSNNDAPIKKVREFDKMYVVRPQYFITFLSLVNSLAMKYKEILTKNVAEAINLKASKDLMDEFDKMKETYLEKPIEQLSKKVEEIQKQSQSIYVANQKIQQACSDIINTTIEEIKAKIERFDIRKISKKLDKITD